MNKEQASENYIQGKLKSHQEYLGCEESRRMTLIQEDLYSVQQSFEDGWDEANKTMTEKACKWLFDNAQNYMLVTGGGYWFNNIGLSENFKKAMEG